jgi:uncharacterized protein (TIGR03067 family)
MRIQPLVLALVLACCGGVPGAHAQSTTAPASAARQAVIAEEFEALTGRWQLVRAIIDGVEVPPGELAQTVLIADHGVVRFAGAAGLGTAPRGPLTIDPGRSPKEADAAAEGGPVTRGIYELVDANTLRLCWGQPGAARPADFTSAPGSGRTLQTWQLIGKKLGG